MNLKSIGRPLPRQRISHLMDVARTTQHMSDIKGNNGANFYTAAEKEMRKKKQKCHRKDDWKSCWNCRVTPGMFGPSLRSGRRPIIRLQITKVLAPFFSFLRTPRFNIVAFIVENSRYEHKKKLDTVLGKKKFTTGKWLSPPLSKWK